MTIQSTNPLSIKVLIIPPNPTGVIAPETVRQIVASSLIIFAYSLAASPNCRPLNPELAKTSTKSSIVIFESNLM